MATIVEPLQSISRPGNFGWIANAAGFGVCLRQDLTTRIPRAF